MVVIGYERLSFPDSKDSSKMVTGTNLYCAYPIDMDKGEGYRYSKKGFERLYISDWFLANRLYGVIPAIGSEVEPSYNRDGRLQDILIKTSK